MVDWYLVWISLGSLINLSRNGKIGGVGMVVKID